MLFFINNYINRMSEPKLYVIFSNKLFCMKISINFNTSLSFIPPVAYFHYNQSYKITFYRYNLFRNSKIHLFWKKNLHTVLSLNDITIQILEK